MPVSRQCKVALRFDLRTPAYGPTSTAKYAASLDLVERADQLGFDYVQVSEHHGAADGYCPSPVVMAAAFAARSRRLRVRIAALLLPLYHPLRVAEDLAVLDLLSGGRLDVVIGAGYRAAEFEAFGIDFDTRGAAVERSIGTLRQAWTGESFELDGRTVVVTPTPSRPQAPNLILAGSSRAAARRAARLGLEFLPQHPSLYGDYERECVRLGVEPKSRSVPLAYSVLVSEDPEAAWERNAEHVLHDMNAYGVWLAEAGMSGSFAPVSNLDEARRTGKYLIVTPDECVDIVTRAGPDCHVMLHPLLAGTPIDEARHGVELFGKRVLPRLR